MTETSKLTNKEKLAIKLLQQAATNWPRTLWLFSANGTLYVMRKKNGKKVMNQRGGVDDNYIETQIQNIDNDGGDW